MRLFFDRREEHEDNKWWVVLKAKPLPHIIFAILLMGGSIPFFIGRFADDNPSLVLGKYTIHYVITWVILSMGLIILRTVEGRGAIIANFKNVEFKKKGSNNISFKHPAELWMEKKQP